MTHRREDNNRVRFLTDEEEKNLRKIVQERWPNHVPELDLAINTGIRKGSQYGLTWDMVDWKSRELHIPRTKNEEPLHVPLNDAAISALKTVFQKGDGKGRVFTSSKTGTRSKMAVTGLMTRSSKRSSRIFTGTTCVTRLRAG